MVKFETAFSLLSTECVNEKYLPEFLPSLLPGTSTELVASSGTGKTQLCMQLCARVLESGRKALYIDTEGALSISRIKDMSRVSAEDINMDNLLTCRCYEASQLIDALRHASNLISIGDEAFKSVDVIIVDSIAYLFRGLEQEEYLDLLDKVGTLISSFCTTKISILFTNHVTDAPSFSQEGYVTRAALPISWSHCATSRQWIYRTNSSQDIIENESANKEILTPIRLFSLSKCPFLPERKWLATLTAEGFVPQVKNE